jgi:hypothetical protein
MIKLLFAFLLCFAGLGLLAQHNNALFKKLKPILGGWQRDKNTGNTHEFWVKQNDSTLLGKSYNIKGTDTTMLETVVLQLRQQKISFVATAADQNNNQPISFTLISSKNNTFIFENKTHDFPTQITYQFLPERKLRASINGIMDGKPVTIWFNFNHIKM